ncbi:hypothetical protein NCCP1664_16770 [Zafaria cholistanensis]|uniref:Ketoreductase domain-containing protein n=1 Tax=Zafaria cholistanensis TaxID=1682741 RepID=A0A5A7NTV1_9MICC|nr:SDR family NAD(P)-dependent oxidoreductase [Zafaria cholistanensis]GER23181.1 hypothetical protein NCCP1664_16770 [Zafaria cholistanensis]
MTRRDDLAGATAVVTGGASGIGRGIASTLVARGMNVVVADIDQAALDRAEDELGVLGVATDVTDADSVAALAERTMAEFGAVHLVCNNAGVGPMAPMNQLTLEDWRWMLEVNLWGVIHGVDAFLPLLERNTDWGHIVNTSSMSVLAPPPKLGAYVASKAAVMGLTEVLAAELAAAESVVSASVLIPGPVRTNIAASLRHRPATSNGALFDVDISGNGKNFRFLDPEQVGELVVDAIGDRRLYIPTHGEWRLQAAERHHRIQSDFPAHGDAIGSTTAQEAS